MIGSFLFISLISSFLLRIYISAFRIEKAKNPEALFKNPLFSFFSRIFPKKLADDTLFFCLTWTEHSLRFIYIFCLATFIGKEEIFSIIPLLALIGGTFIILDVLPRQIGSKFSKNSLSLTTPTTFILLVLFLPFSWILLHLSHFFHISWYQSDLDSRDASTKKELIAMIQSANLNHEMDLHDKKIIASVLTFKERIAREIMVPRVDVFALSEDTTIQKAAELLDAEGYSRIPVYKNTIDEIIGVLMYKDVISIFNQYLEKENNPKILEAPISSILKNVLYTPETKKISSLLQDFRKSQVHLAIVVDEYGGTEGIVSIEDILEEIVGEIADEYDDEALLYSKSSDGSYTVDARMNIFDVEEVLGIIIPQDGEYDTLGGYIYHETGSIPPKGFTIHHNHFEITVLSSNERSIEKVKIRCLNP